MAAVVQILYVMVLNINNLLLLVPLAVRLAVELQV